MTEIDTRFSALDISLLRKMCGQTLTCLKCDPFDYSTAVYGAVGVCLDKYAVQFTNNIEVLDHFGALEDVAIFKMSKTTQDKIRSQVEGTTMIELPVQQRISQIFVINDHQAVLPLGAVCAH